MDFWENVVNNSKGKWMKQAGKSHGTRERCGLPVCDLIVGGCFLSLEVDLITLSAGKSRGSPLNRFLCHGGKMGFNGIHGLWSSSHHPTPRFMAVNGCLGRPTVPDISPAGRPRTTAHLDNLAFAWQCPWGLFDTWS